MQVTDSRNLRENKHQNWNAGLKQEWEDLKSVGSSLLGQWFCLQRDWPSNSAAYLCTVLGLGYSNQEFQHRLRLGNQGSYCVDNGSECGKRLQTWSEERWCSVKTKLPRWVQIKGLRRWKNNLHLMQTLPSFFRPSPFVSDARIPDASEEIMLSFNSYTLRNPWLQHNYCLFLLFPQMSCNLFLPPSLSHR